MSRRTWERAKARRIEPRKVFVPEFRRNPALSLVRDFDPPTPEQLRNQPPHEQGRGLLRQDQWFRWPPYAMNSLPANANVIEIARFHVPAGHVGFVTHIWTSIVAWVDGEEPGTYFPISLNLPLTPWVVQLLGRLRYWLRLEGMRQNEPVAPIVIGGPAQQLPGQPFAPLATWDDNRFSWGWNHPPFKLFVPERCTLRLFIGPDLQCNLFNPCPDDYRCKLGECIYVGPIALAKSGGGLFSISPDKAARLVSALAPGSTGAKVLGPAALAEPMAVTGVVSEGGLEIAGRLAGYTQSYSDNIAATENSRELW